MKFTNKKSKAIGSTKYFKFYFFLIFSLLMQTKQLFAQNELDAKAPTLQIGLDGFSFEKGTLDAQLIMEIVAQKQQELKIKAVQNVFLSKVKDAGGTIYSFTDNVVRELVFEKDQNVRTKKILENTVNFVFVCSYLDYFLSTLSETEIVNLKKLAKNYGYKDNELGTQFTLKSFIKEKRQNSSDYYSDDRAIEFLTLLLDMCSEVVHQDDKLKQLVLLCQVTVFS